jgi:flagellar biosynthesis/type III secretory pathway protein FliH
MKKTYALYSLLGVIVLAGCKPRPKVELPQAAPSKESKKPVIFVAPVETKPYEEGYRAGYDLGRDQATPEAKLPESTEVQRMAREQASERPDRNERWERGFAEGYADGFRKVVTGQK